MIARDKNDNQTAKRARAYLESFATGNPDQIVTSVSEDFVNEHVSELGEGSVGRAAYRRRLPEFLRDMTDLRYQVEDLVQQGDRVMVCYRMTARWKGQIPITIRGAQHLTIRDDLVAKRIDYWDSASFLSQIKSDEDPGDGDE